MIKQSEFDNVRHLLPDVAKELVRFIGIEKTFLLVKELGGTRFPVAKNMNKHGEIRYAVIAEIVGVDAADIITKEYGGFDLYIPKCLGVVTEARNRMIRAYFDKETVSASGKEVTMELALKYKLSYRQIEVILSQTDKEEFKEKQQSLF